MSRFFALQLVTLAAVSVTARRLLLASSSAPTTPDSSSTEASNSGGIIHDVSIHAVQFSGYGLSGDWDGLIMPDFEDALMTKSLDFAADFETLAAYISGTNGGSWFCSDLSFRNTTAYLIALKFGVDGGEVTLPYWCRDEAAEVVGVPSDWGMEEIFIRGVVFPYPGGIPATWEEIPRPDFQAVLRGQTIPADMDLFRDETESLLSTAFGSPWTCSWNVNTPLSTTSYSIAVRWPGFHSLTQAWCYAAVDGWSSSFVEAPANSYVNTINTWAEPHNANGVTPNTVIDSNDEPPCNNQQRMIQRGY